MTEINKCQSRIVFNISVYCALICLLKLHIYFHLSIQAHKQVKNKWGKNTINRPFYWGKLRSQLFLIFVSIVRCTVNLGRPLGSERFVERAKLILQRQLKKKKPGQKSADGTN